MPTNSTKVPRNSTKASKPRKAAPRPRKQREPGTAMVPKHPRAWMGRYRCGCTIEFPTRESAPAWCPTHLRNPSAEPFAVFEGDKPPPEPEGRPTKYSPEIAEQACKLVAMGWRQRDFNPERGLVKLVDMGHEPEEALRILEALPARATLGRWLVDHDEFRVLYTRAKLTYAEHGMAEEIEEIADDGTQDVVLTMKGPMVDHEHISRSKLRVEQRRWLVERLLPVSKQVTLLGDKDKPLLIGQSAKHQLTDEELMAEIIERRRLRLAHEARTLPSPTREGETK